MVNSKGFYAFDAEPKPIDPEEFEELELHNILKTMDCISVVKKHTNLIGRKEELDLLEESLYKKRMRNSVIVGAAGVGKTAIIEELSHKMKDKFHILQFDIPSTVAGTKYRGEFEEKLTKSLRKIVDFNKVAMKKIILFIDEIHTLAEAGGAEGAVNAGNIFKPYLSNGDITIIGATTLNEYNKYIKKDNALSRRLPAIYVKPLKDEEVLKVLNSFSEGTVCEEGLKYIFEKSRNIPEAQNPDISIEILDRCMARSKCRKEDISNKMIDEIVEYFLR